MKLRGGRAEDLHLEGESVSGWVWVGLGLQTVGILFWECFFAGWERFCQIGAKWNAGDGRRPAAIELFLMKGVGVLGLQFITIQVFGLLLDGGIRFRACCYVYLIYAGPALLLLALRWKVWTRAEVLFLRWGWAPIIAIGLPLLLPTLKTMGLVRIIS